MEKYCDTNLNYYIKIKLTEEGRIIYKKHYAKYNCDAPKLNIDNEGYVQFQIHDFMNIFGERLFMGVTLPCETNCKIQVKDEWHFVKDGDLPKAYQKCYFIYSNSYGEDNKVIFSKYNINVLTGVYAFFLDEETGEETTDPCFYDDINDDEIGLEEVYAWKEIVLPELKESE